MMKIEANQQKKLRTSVLLAATALTVFLSLAQPAFSAAEILGSWVTGTSHTKEAGSDRVFVVIAHAESSTWSDPTLSTVTYGGQIMTKIADIFEGSGYVTKAYVGAFVLNEAGVEAASSGTISATWSGTRYTSLTSVFLENVEQTVPVMAYATNGATNAATVTTSALSTNDGDIVIEGGTCSQIGTYTANNDFTKDIDLDVSGFDGMDGHKAATGADETPSITHSTSSNNRQAIIGFVVQGMISDPNKATHPSPGNGASGVLPSASLSWDAPTAYTPSSYDVYFGTNPSVYSNPKHTVYTESYDPPGALEYGTTYYWVVDSYDGGTKHPGFEWSFTTFVISDRVAGNMILLNDNGGWCWYQDEKIAYDPVGGNLLTSTTANGIGFGGIGGTRNDDTDATQFNIATGKRTRTVAKEPYGGDDHNMGAFWIRPDGKYMHFYCEHYTDYTTFYRQSTYPNDGSAWNAEQSYDWMAIPGSPGEDEPNFYDSSYTNIHYLSGEDRLYNIHRIFARTPCIAYSDDWGENWTYMGRLNSPVGGQTYSNFYHKFANNGVDRIDFIGCENHPRDNNNNVYHGYIKNGKSYDSNGVEIDTINDQDAPSVQAFTPIFIADTTIDANSYHTGWTNELELDKDGYPVCLYQTRHGTEPWGWDSGSWGNIGAADHRFFYARFGFDGTEWKWTSTELCKMGGGLHLPEQDYLGMGCIHPDDANVVYVATQFDPRDDTEYEYREIFKGVTADRGLTWDWTQITFDSTQNNTRPAIPKWDANNTAVVWTRGNWNQNDYEQYDLVVVGLIEQEGVTLGKVSYIDATESNTKESDDSAFTPTGPDDNPGAVDDQWHEYTGYGNGGSCYTAGDSGTEDAPTIKTTISGLADGTYDVFAYFWANPEEDWGVRGGFTSSDMLCFSKQSSQFAEASQFSGSVTVLGNGVELYRVYIGRKEVSGGTSVDVYIDDYDDSYNSNPPDHTTYDGVGVASVITGAVPGDLDGDGKVNMIDIAVLGQDWQPTYDIYTLADIADYWLYGT